MYFTERIQNTLLRPEILRLMQDQKQGGSDYRRKQEERKKKEQMMTQEELMKLRHDEHEKRKRARID